MRRFLGFLLLLCGVLWSVYAVGAVVDQDRRIKSFTAVEAHVLDSRISTHRGGKSTSYSPTISYEYQVDGDWYRSSQVMAYDENGSYSWADEIVSQFPKGLHVSAYLDPLNPKEAILIRRYSATPYFLAGLSTAMTSVGLLMLLGVIRSRRTEMQAVLLEPAGWQLLLPQKSVRRNLRDAFLTFIFSGLPGLLIVGHVAWVHPSISFFGWLPLLAGLGVMTLEIMWLVRAWNVSRHISDPRVQVNPAPMKLGEPLGVRAEFDAYSPVHMKSMQASIVCVEHYREKRGNKTEIGIRTRGEKRIDLGPGADVAAGQVLERCGTAAFGCGECPITGPPGAKAYPYYTWELRLAIEFLGAADYAGVFPLAVIA